LAVIQPFRAVRYNPEKVKDLGAVTAPPYDVLSAEDCERLRQRHPYNVIRLILGPQLDSSDDKRYEEAARTWRRWLADGILITESEPALYVCQQEFEWEGRSYRRKGLVCLVRLEPYENKVILPHEHTFPSHKRDRYKLLEATKANLDSVFGIYDEERGCVSDLLGQAASGTPMMVAEADGEVHQIWRLSDPLLIREVADALAHEPIVIADGHHRYETALAYKLDQFVKSGVRMPALDYVLMTLCSVRDPGLLVLPTHRIVALPPGINIAPDVVVSKLVEGLAFGYDAEECVSVDHLLENLKENSRRGFRAFGVYVGAGNCYMVKSKGAVSSYPSEDMDALAKDVIERLPDLLGVSSVNLGYTQSASQAVREVDSGKAVMAILVNPVPVSEVFSAAVSGRRMPEKSTYFYPKLRSGLLMRSLDDPEPCGPL
jgi:uncharacterized protein (DUF1015 family)